MLQKLVIFSFIFLMTSVACAEQRKVGDQTQVASLVITTLSTSEAGPGIGEWGYSALIEADGHKILFDTGRGDETVLRNAELLGIDLSGVYEVFLSHSHTDHVGGLLTLREQLVQRNPKALSRVHVARGIFSRRVRGGDRMLKFKQQFEATGGQFVIYDTQHELFPGIWLTGPIGRMHAEKNWSGRGRIITDNGLVEDIIPEDQSLVINTARGFILVSGCGHAGIVNAMEHTTQKIHAGPVYAAVGGFHLIEASPTQLQWTAQKLSEFGVQRIAAAHCTGTRALNALQAALQLPPTAAVESAVGDRFVLKPGHKTIDKPDCEPDS